MDFNGRVAGVSNIFGSLISGAFADLPWRLLFLVGLPLGAGIGLSPSGPGLLPDMMTGPADLALSPVMLVLSGLLVGIGTRARPRLHLRPRRVRPRQSLAALDRGGGDLHGDGGGDRLSGGASRMSEPTGRGQILFHAAALVAGSIFGMGLAVSGMIYPAKVKSFLDISSIASGGWDPASPSCSRRR